MLESFSAVVHHSLRSGRSSFAQLIPLVGAVEPLNFKSIPTRQVMPSDFFTPKYHPNTSRTRRPRGKERIQHQHAEATTLHWDPGCTSQCTDWLCFLNQSFWMSRRSRMLMMREFGPPRESPVPRKQASTSAPGPRMRITRNRLFASPPSRLCTRQASSNAQTVPAAPPPQLDADHSLHLLQQIVSIPTFKFNVDEGITALEHLATLKQMDSFSQEELLTLFDRLVSVAEKGVLRAESSLLGDRARRLRTLLEVVLPDVPSRTLEDVTRACFVVRCMAFSGDLQNARDLLQEYQGMPIIHAAPAHIVKVYERILLATHRYYGIDKTLDFLMAEWGNIGPFLSTLPKTWPDPQTEKQGLSLRQATFSILSSIVNPEDLLVARKKTWDLKRRRKLGHLLIEALCSCRHPDDAHSVYQEMCNQGMRVRIGLVFALVRSLARSQHFAHANVLFRSFDSSIDTRPYLSTGLYLVAQQGMVDQAEGFFQRLAKRDGWVTEPDTAMLIYSYATQGKADEALAVFNRLFPVQENGKRNPEPRSIHYSIIIYAYAERGDFTAMNEWLEIMANAGLPPDIYVYSTILRSFAVRGDVDSIATVLDQMRAAGIRPSVVPYTSAMTLLAHRKDPVAAEALYKRALEEGVVPDRRMINTVMDAHVEAGSWHGVIRVFDYLRNSRMQHVRLSIETYNTLLKAYVLIGAPFRVVSKLFGRLEAARVRPNVRTFTLVVQSACDSGLMDIAAEIVAEMDRLSHDPHSDIELDAQVLTIVMTGYLRLGDKIKAKEVYDEMLHRGIQPTAVTFGTILKSYGHDKSEESLKIAEEFLGTLMASDNPPQNWAAPTHGGKSALTFVYGPLITSYSRRQRPEDVERLFQGYLDVGGEPTIGILATLMNVYRRTGNIQAVQQIWPQIFQLGLRYTRMDGLFKDISKTDRHRSRLQANILCIPLSMYIDALSAAGLHNDIATVWSKFQAHGFTFDSHNWNHLVVALVRAGEPERAFEVIERVILPFQKQTIHLLKTRDETPDSPLSFDKLPPTREDLQDEPSQEAPMHSSERRASIAKTIFKQIRESPEDGESIFNNGEPSDFAHPLRILHQISPSWNIWAPHTASLNVLLMVLLRLQEGALVDPVQPEREPSATAPQPNPQLDAITKSQLARDMLHRIYQNYPKAVRAVLDHELKEKRRLGSDYDQTYNWR